MLFCRLIYTRLLTAMLLVAILQIFAIPEVSASPPFNRQEIKDSTSDWVIKKTDMPGVLFTAPDGQTFPIMNANKIGECKDDNGSFLFPDVAAVSYLSDGKTLDVTLWLSSPFRDPTTSDKLWTPESFKQIPFHYIGYTISIDVISAYETGPDYYATIKWDPVTQQWTKVIEEGSSVTGEKRIIREEGAAGFYDFGKNYILFSVPLEKIGSPQQYNILLSTYDTFIKNELLCELVDISNWVQVPPPEFSITTSPNPIVLRPGEKIDVEVQVKSLTNIKSNVHLAMDEVDGLILTLPAKDAYVPPLGVGTLLLEVKATDVAKYRTYTVPVYANHTYLTVSKIRGGDFVQNQVSTSTLDLSNFIITVRPPLTVNEQFSTFWGTYGGAIGLVGGGIVGTMVKILFDKREKRKSSQSVAKTAV